MRGRHRTFSSLQVVLGLTMVGVGILKFVRPNFKVQNDVTLQAFIDAGWLWPLIGAAETVGGLAVASGVFVPLGLVVLAPVVAGIAAFALKTGGEETSVGFVVLAMHLSLCWHWRDAFRPLLTRSSPTGRKRENP